MNTCEPAAARSRTPPPVSFRARGCVLTDDSRVEVEEIIVKPDLSALKLKEQAERDSIRRAAEEEADRRMRHQLESMRQDQRALWTQFNAELGQTLKGLEANIRHQLIEMSIRTTEILLCHKLPDADMVRSILVEVLSPISDLQGVRVRVAKGTLHMLTGGADTPPAHPGVECVEDPELKPGDVIVESRNGIFDGRLSLRLSQLAEALAQPPVDDSKET